MFFYIVVGTAFLLFLIIPQVERNFAAEGFSYLFMISTLLYLSWVIITDKPTMRYILGRRIITTVFLGAIIFSIIVSAQLLPHALGRYVGILNAFPYRANQVFPTVQMTVDQPICQPELHWRATDEGFSTDAPILLILHTNDGWFLRQTIEPVTTFFVPLEHVIGFRINIPSQSSSVNENSNPLD